MESDGDLLQKRPSQFKSMKSNSLVSDSVDFSPKKFPELGPELVKPRNGAVSLKISPDAVHSKSLQKKPYMNTAFHFTARDTNPYLQDDNEEAGLLNQEQINSKTERILRNAKTMDSQNNLVSKSINAEQIFDSIHFNNSELQKSFAEQEHELVKEKIKRKESEELLKNMNTDLKYQEKEIFFLREENIKAKQEIENYKEYIEDLIRHNGLQIDQQTAENLNLDLNYNAANIQTYQHISTVHDNKNGEE